MTRTLVRAAWILVAVVAMPGWVLSLYVLPMNFVAVALLFTLGFTRAIGRALDAFMLTLFGGLVLTAAFTALVVRDGQASLRTIAFVTLGLASVLLVLKCGAIYGQIVGASRSPKTPLPVGAPVTDGHRTGRSRAAAFDDAGRGRRWLALIPGVCGMVATFTAVVMFLLPMARNVAG